LSLAVRSENVSLAVRSSRRRALAVVAVVAVMLAAVLSALASPTHIKVIASCPGSYRWDVKTLTDDLASKVHYKSAAIVATSVAMLRDDDPGVVIHPSTARRSNKPDELTVYRVTAKLVKAKTEYTAGNMKGDEDIHLVIADPDHPALRMVAEFPRGGCIPESNSTKASAMDKARAAFIKACGTPPLGSFKTFPATARATITGVGFFDVKHNGGQPDGAAPFFREIHPVLSFKAVSC
jgi:hypothetical protein